MAITTLTECLPCEVRAGAVGLEALVALTAESRLSADACRSEVSEAFKIFGYSRYARHRSALGNAAMSSRARARTQRNSALPDAQRAWTGERRTRREETR